MGSDRRHGPYNLPGIKRLKLTPGIIWRRSTWVRSPVLGQRGDQEGQPRRQRCPSTHITVAFRSDGSGDTYAFTNYLWKISSEWKTKVGIYATSVNFPTGVGGKRQRRRRVDRQVDRGCDRLHLGVVRDLARHLVAAVQNAARKYIYPNLKPFRRRPRRSARSRRQRSAHREPLEEVPEGLPDLHVHVRDRPEDADEEGGSAEVRPVRDRRWPEVRCVARLRTAAGLRQGCCDQAVNSL